MQCGKCSKINQSNENKPEYCDYFLCDCYGKRKLGGFGPELIHWSDKVCAYCSKEQNCCRTCKYDLTLDDIEEDKMIQELVEEAINHDCVLSLIRAFKPKEVCLTPTQLSRCISDNRREIVKFMIGLDLD